MENVRDTYHASLLHVFFTTFRLTRLSFGGGVMVSENGVAHASTTKGPPDGPDHTYDGMRADNQGFQLQDPSFMRSTAEFNDDINIQILSIFPGFILQQIHNALAVRQIVPRGVDKMDLNWTYLGFADDTPELRAMRLKQSNLAGPAGFVSMEDGCAWAASRAAWHRGARNTKTSVVEMGGSGRRKRRKRGFDRRPRCAASGSAWAWRAYGHLRIPCPPP